MRPFLAIVPVLLGGCQFVFDEDPPWIPVDDRPAPAGVRVTTAAGADSLRFVRGRTPDDVWIALFHAQNDGSTPAAVRLVHLAPPFEEERHTADHIYVRRGALYRVHRKDGPGPACAGAPCLVVHTPGAASDDVFPVPRGSEYLLDAPADVGFLYFASGNDTYLLQRRDGSFKRSIRARVPDTGPRGATLGGPAFDATGARLVNRSDTCQPPDQALRPPGPCLGAVAVHATTSARDWLLTDILLGDAVVLDAPRDALLTCGLRGVRSVPLDPAVPTRVLDADPGCLPLGSADTTAVLRSAAWVSGDFAYYQRRLPKTGGGSAGDAGAGDDRYEVRAVPLDGSAPPRVLSVADGAERVLLLRGFTDPVYSLDPGGRYAGDAGDGWIAGARFMERGRAVTAARDGDRLRFLEHAATLNAAGELRSVALDGAGHVDPAGPALRLAANVTDYHELPDGRLVCAADQPYAGPHNRILLIDERARTARVLAAGTPSYYRIPESTDVLAVKQNADDSYDLLRVPIPPP